MLKVLDVDGAVRRVKGGWQATGQPWGYDEPRYQRVSQSRRTEQQAMLDYVTSTECRMQFLRRALDDPGARACGRCDNCGGLELCSSIDSSVVAQAQTRIDRPGVAIEPRRVWPVGMDALGVAVRGKIPAAELPDTGRAVALLTDLGWGVALRELFAPGSPDQQLPIPLRRALVEVLDEWFHGDGPPGPTPSSQFGPGRIQFWSSI